MTRFVFILTMVLALFFRMAAQDTTLAGIVPVDESGKILWQQVVQVPGKNKEQLYNQGIEWINTYFPNPAGVTHKRSAESGVVEGRYSIRLTDDHDGTKVPSKTVSYTFKLEFREGRFRYTFTDFTLQASSRFPLERWLDKEGPWYDIQNKPYLEQIRDTMEDMIGKMTAYITKPDKPAEEDW